MYSIPSTVTLLILNVKSKHPRLYIRSGCFQRLVKPLGGRCATPPRADQKAILCSLVIVVAKRQIGSPHSSCQYRHLRGDIFGMSLALEAAPASSRTLRTWWLSASNP